MGLVSYAGVTLKWLCELIGMCMYGSWINYFQNKAVSHDNFFGSNC